MSAHKLFLEYLTNKDKDPEKAKEALLTLATVFVRKEGADGSDGECESEFVFFEEEFCVPDSTGSGNSGNGGEGNGGNGHSGLYLYSGARKRCLFARELYTPQELTRQYDEKVGKLFSLMQIGVSFNLGFINHFYMEEILYFILLHLRREEKWELFIDFFNAIPDSDIKDFYFTNPLLESYNLYYDFYNHRKDVSIKIVLDKMQRHVDSVRPERKNYWADCCYAATCITAADLFYKLLSSKSFAADYAQYYDDAITYSQQAIDNFSNYAVYYYIKAKISYRFQRTSDYDKIIDLLDIAMEKENDTDYGERQKSKYNALRAEIISKEMANKNKDAEDRIKKQEERSMKRFSAFVALITVVIGLLSKFGGDSGGFSGVEAISFILVLIGGAIMLFTALNSSAVEVIYYAVASKIGKEKIEITEESPSFFTNKKKSSTERKVRIFELVACLLLGLLLIAGGILLKIYYPTILIKIRHK